MVRVLGGREQIGEGAAKFRREHGLEEDAIHLLFVVSVGDLRAQLRAEDQNFAFERKGANLRDEFETVETRHVMIADQEVVRLGIFGDAVERFLAVIDTFDQVTFAAKGDAGDLTEFPHVVSIQNSE
jgi:hypothetical protein